MRRNDWLLILTLWLAVIGCMAWLRAGVYGPVFGHEVMFTVYTIAAAVSVMYYLLRTR